MDLRPYIRTIPDFPSPGIQFRDITSLLGDATAYRYVIDSFLSRYRAMDLQAVAGIESRGFIFAAALAYQLGLPLVPIRKEGKLPHTTLKQEYALEYGNNAVEIHTDALSKNQRVLVVDDLLATGGTLHAANKLVELLGAEVVEDAVVIELANIGGRRRLDRYNVCSLLCYDGD